MPNTIIIAKAYVFNAAGQVLILTRSQTAPHRAGQSDLPGGHVERGEAYAAAVMRELAEETGIVMAETNTTLFFTHTEFAYDLSIIRFFYVTHIAGEPVIQLSQEHSAFQWLPAGDVPAVLVQPIQRAAYQYGLDHGCFDSAVSFA